MSAALKDPSTVPAPDPFEQMIANWWRWPDDVSKSPAADGVVELEQCKAWTHVASVCWGSYFALSELAEQQRKKSGQDSARTLYETAHMFELASDLAYQRSQMVFVRGAS